MTRAIKRAKMQKSRGVGTEFGVWSHVLVVVRRGCKGFGDLIFIICDLNGRLRGYMLRVGV